MDGHGLNNGKETVGSSVKMSQTAAVGGEVRSLSIHRLVRERNDESALHAMSFPVEAKRRHGNLLLFRTRSELH
jgi:hypothetical protein